MVVYAASRTEGLGGPCFDHFVSGSVVKFSVGLWILIRERNDPQPAYSWVPAERNSWPTFCELLWGVYTIQHSDPASWNFCGN